MQISNDGQHLTKDQFIRVLPKSLRNSVNSELLDSVNEVIGNKNSLIAEFYRDNIISYTGVLKEGKFKIADYINAVRYVSYKLLGSTNIVAYTRSFPDKYQKFVDNGVNDKDIASYISSYNKNKLVNLIMAQTLVPSYVLNADLYQKALNASADLMVNAKSEKVRCDAANNLMNQLQVPENKKVELSIGIKEDSLISDLKAATAALVAEQRSVLESGVSSITQIATSSIVSNVEKVVEESND